MSKIKIGAQVTAKVRPTKVTVSGTFQGYRLEDQEDPTSICGTVLHVKDGMQHLDYVYVDSIKVCESKDERIRQEIISAILSGRVYDTDLVGAKHIFELDKEVADAWIAYLEKQKEQKESVEEVLIKAGLKPYKDGNQWCILIGDNIQEGICGFGDTIDDALYHLLKEAIAYQKEQKPAEWSDEDRTTIERIVETIQDYAMETGQIDEVTCGTKEPLITYIRFLRSLRPQPHWKPSEEQMKSLAQAVCIFATFEHLKDDSKVLTSLYNELAKLPNEDSHE